MLLKIKLIYDEMEDFQYRISRNREVVRPLFFQKQWLERFLEMVGGDPKEAYAAWLRWVAWYEKRRPDRLPVSVLNRTGRLIEWMGVTETNQSVILIRTRYYHSDLRQEWIEDSMIYCFEEHLRRDADKLVIIIGNKDIGLRNLHHNIPGMLRTILHLMMNNYPSMLHILFINDMSFLARAVWLAVRDFIPDRIRCKIRFTRDVYEEMLPVLGNLTVSCVSS